MTLRLGDGARREESSCTLQLVALAAASGFGIATVLGTLQCGMSRENVAFTSKLFLLTYFLGRIVSNPF